MTQIHIGVKMIVRVANRIVFSNQTLFGVVCQCQAPTNLSNDPYRPLTHGNPLRTRRSPGTPVLNPQVSLAQFAIVVPSLGCLATYAIPCLWVSQTYSLTQSHTRHRCGRHEPLRHGVWAGVCLCGQRYGCACVCLKGRQ